MKIQSNYTKELNLIFQDIIVNILINPWQMAQRGSQHLGPPLNSKQFTWLLTYVTCIRNGGAMKRQRRKHSAEFKARVPLEAVKGLKTVNEIAADFEIHPVMLSNWKKEMLQHLPDVFEKTKRPMISSAK